MRLIDADALPLEEQARLGLLPDALPPCDIARLWAAEKLGSPDYGPALETEVYCIAAEVPESESAPGEKTYCLPSRNAKLSRNKFHDALEAKGEPLPRFWFTEDERRAAQAHKAVLARHGYTVQEERTTKAKARQLWQRDPTISIEKMRTLCTINGKPCPRAWMEKVHKSLNLPNNLGGRPRR